MEAVRHWVNRLGQGGVVLLEEVEAIDTDDEVLAGYLELQREMLAANGNVLEVGPSLEAELGADPELEVASGLARLEPGIERAARMFGMNLRAWRDRPEVADAHSADELDRIQGALDRRADGGGPGSIVWSMRQIACRPSAGQVPPRRALAP